MARTGKEVVAFGVVDGKDDGTLLSQIIDHRRRQVAVASGTSPLTLGCWNRHYLAGAVPHRLIQPASDTGPDSGLVP